MPRYTRQEASAAVEDSYSLSEVLRKLGLRAAGGNHKVLKHWLTEWGIATDHFDPDHYQRRPFGNAAIPLDEILVEGSTYSRGHLKQRLYETGLKQRRCELCGQGEEWRGQPISLILDHVNGIGTDNRIENLRIVCPNCNATLDTHCGRKNRLIREVRDCAMCGEPFTPRYEEQRYCSRRCSSRSSPKYTARPSSRKVARPPYDQLIDELAETNFCAVARKYGVSDNAVRKWVRWYEADLTIRAGPPDAAADQDAAEP